MGVIQFISCGIIRSTSRQWPTHIPATAGAARGRRRAAAGRYWGVALTLLLLVLAMGPRLSVSAASQARPTYPASWPGTWSPTGSMSTARWYHTATLLPSGQVLVVGGCVVNGTGQCLTTLAGAEVYDPTTGTWAATGGLLTARAAHTAILLPDGQVLVAGGLTCAPGCAPLSTAELYNPATGTWTQTGHLATARQNHTATLLPNGQVLVVGGQDSNSNTLASAELYDPATFTWMPTGSLTTSRQNHTATLLSNGQVLVAGGCSGAFPCSATASAELYNPATATWAVTGHLNTAREKHTATLLSDGTVLVAGGATGTSPSLVSIASAELYYPYIGAWIPTASMQVARNLHTATLLTQPGGPVLVAGGWGSSGGITSAEVYNPSTYTWTPALDMATARYADTATLLPNGQVLVAGGSSSTSTELFTGGAYPWVQLSPSALNFGYQLVGTGSQPQTVIVTNTGTAPLVVSSITLTAPGTSTFPITTTCMAGPVNPGATCTIGVGFTPAVTGSVSAGMQIVDNAPTSPQSVALAGTGTSYGPNTWTPVNPMTTPRYGHTATLLPDGKVLVAGGCTTPGYFSYYNGTCVGASASAELYDPSTGTWSPTGSMMTGRELHIAMLLPNGKVLVSGGSSGASGVDWCGKVNCNSLFSAELYDPSTGTWSATGSMTGWRYDYTATLLPNGKVLVAGGCGVYNWYGTDCVGVNNSAELYDPGTGTWAFTGSMAIMRYNHTATLLPNGQVLVAGGCNDSGCYSPLASAEVYDPSTGTWMATASMATPRAYHTATLLPNGQVLVAGGSGSSAELYNPSTGTWMATGSMNSARAGHRATLLPNGQVLVAGGCEYSEYATCPFSELYVPDLGTWLSVGSATGLPSLADDSATLLPNGRVLVAGGGPGLPYPNTVLADAQLFTPALLTLSPGSGVAGQTITITGANFLPHEAVTLYWDSIANSPTATVPAGGDGSFTLTSTVPLLPLGAHTLFAVGQTSGAQTTASFTVTPQVNLTPNNGAAGSTVVATGSGFGILEPVALHWNAPAGQLLGQTISSPQGAFTGTAAVTFTVPLSPTGSYTVYSLGLASGATCATGFLIGPGPTPTPAPCTTPTPTPTNTPTPVPSPTASNTPTAVPSATSTSTPTPTFTAAPPTNTPTHVPSPTASNTPAATPTVTAVPPTPSPIATPSSSPVPPTGTPIVPPSSTPFTPPSNTPVAPATSTPQPTTAALTPPTNTPVTPPSNTPVTPPTTTSLPSPGATPTVHPPAGGHKPPARLALVLRLAPARVVSGNTLTVAVQTASHARLTLSLQVSTTRTVVHGSGKHRKRVTQTHVLYHLSAHGTADRHGRWTARLHITYRPARAVQAMLTVTARTTHSSTTRRVHVTIEPPHRSRSSHHAHH